MSQLDLISVVPALDASILANNDVFMQAFEIPQVFNKGKARKLQSVTVLDTDDQNQAFDLIFSNATITLGTTNDVVSINDADAAKVLGVVKMVVATHAYDLLASILFAQHNLGMVMQGSGTSNSLWISAVCRSGTPTYTAAGFKIKLGFE